jgi:hypothetical protein
MMVRACIGPEKEPTTGGKEKKIKVAKEKIKNSDADGPLTSKIRAKKKHFLCVETFSSHAEHFY